MVFTICFHKEILQNLQLWFWSKLKFTNNLWTNKVETILSCPTYPCFSKPRDSKYALPSCCRCMALCFEKKAKPSQEPSCFQRTCWTFPLPLGFPLLFFSPHLISPSSKQMPLAFCHQKLTYKAEPLVVSFGCFHRYHFLVSHGRCCPIFLWY